MPFDHAHFARSRPYLYHLTARENLAGIAAERRLRSAAQSLEAAGRGWEKRVRRPEGRPIRVDGRTVHLRDQGPLRRGNVGLRDGWTFEDLVEYLNHHVFFWPGTAEGPNDYGQRHFARYQQLTPDELAILRIPTQALIQANLDKGPGFSRCNSGSPRWSGGKIAERGPNTFVGAEQFDGAAGRVVEVVYVGQVRLPAEVEWAPSLSADWERLPAQTGAKRSTAAFSSSAVTSGEPASTRARLSRLEARSASCSRVRTWNRHWGRSRASHFSGSGSSRSRTGGTVVRTLEQEPSQFAAARTDGRPDPGDSAGLG